MEDQPIEENSKPAAAAQQERRREALASLAKFGAITGPAMITLLKAGPVQAAGSDTQPGDEEW